MPTRDRKDLDLVAWISDAEGNMIPEYQTTIEGSAVICWIPSVEGTRFFVNWSGNNTIPEYESLDIRCQIWLDGREVTTWILTASERAEKMHATIGYHLLSDEKMRPFKFGKLTLTDDLVDSRAMSPEDLNTITIQLNWGTSHPMALDEVSILEPSSNGPIPEQKVKNGNYSSAGLGEIAPREAQLCLDFTDDEDILPLFFFFHHAPADWLKAEGYMPRSPASQTPDPEPPVGPLTNGRNHSPTRPHPEREFIDVDVFDDSGFKLEPLEDMKPAISVSRPTQARKRHCSEPEYIDVDALSDSESNLSESEGNPAKSEPLEDIKPTRTASSSCCNCSCNRTQTRPKPEHMMDIDRSSAKPITHIRTRKRRRSEREYIDVDSLSDSEFKPANLKLEPTDIKPKFNPRGSRFTPGTGASKPAVFDEDITFLSHSTRTEIPLVGPNSNKRFKVVLVYEEDDSDIKPKMEELALA